MEIQRSLLQQANETYREANDYWSIRMKEFILAALPWVVISLCIAVLAVRTVK